MGDDMETRLMMLWLVVVIGLTVVGIAAGV